MTPANWFDQLDPARSINQLFEHIPNLMYFVKDRESRIVTGNIEFAHHCGVRTPEALWGRTDEELFPAYMTRKFLADDRTVFARGEPLLNLIELFPSRERLPEWFITQKLPLFDRAGEVCGLCGTVQSYEDLLNSSQDPVLELVQRIRDNYAQTFSIPDLAHSIGLSQRQLERRFQATFRMSPRQFIVRLRVLIASDQLRHGDAPITDVAHACGFYDHSSFIRHFRTVFETSPLAYRKRFQGQAAP
ncbi:AraC family transcriptional regulator [Synoicihabitans lomoniglobus]|uniref:Helix-turn-helix domain-containing protein n=1 Tax=Synoicihabitans lomoniglobus TaxID=2909285 RepID=A0AAF0CG31_9BACT|nr:helix-turn-helix domain-containing protein [Opitutaceae bacterium LMO-M01]WED63122.1 helix-turn-helix domain-containing protein [Opitutaceae bacterium LMO-M01]